jgi:hypothetical protein
MKKNIVRSIGLMTGLWLLSNLGVMAQSISNYCTTTEYIYQLRKGMTLNEVNTLLRVEPKDLYFSAKDGSKIVTYKYKIAYQEVPTEKKDRADYLRGGEGHYKDEATLYVVFDAKNNQMLRYITDSGRSSSTKLLRNEQVIKLKD